MAWDGQGMIYENGELLAETLDAELRRGAQARAEAEQAVTEEGDLKQGEGSAATDEKKARRAMR